MKIILLTILVAGMLAFNQSTASATTDCTFTISGTVMNLDSDCTTDQTIFVPDGWTLDGNGKTITAVDPPAGSFLGAVIKNEGAVANVKNLSITTDSLANSCKPAAPVDNRLRGILFDGASGSITHNTVLNINKGPSGCQEGNAIEVRNAPFDGTHPDTRKVEISHNKISAYQKTGIVANGDVEALIKHNHIAASATQENLAANSIQLGFGAIGTVTQNIIEGNQWMGTSDFAATAILVFDARGDVSKNNIRGNSDIGIYIFGNGVTVNNNKVFDIGADHANSGYDIGIVNVGNNNSITNNKVMGFEEPYYGVLGGKNKVIPGPQPGNEFF